MGAFPSTPQATPASRKRSLERPSEGDLIVEASLPTPPATSVRKEWLSRKDGLRREVIDQTSMQAAQAEVQHIDTKMFEGSSEEAHEAPSMPTTNKPPAGPSKPKQPDTASTYQAIQPPQRKKHTTKIALPRHVMQHVQTGFATIEQAERFFFSHNEQTGDCARGDRSASKYSRQYGREAWGEVLYGPYTTLPDRTISTNILYIRLPGEAVPAPLDG